MGWSGLGFGDEYSSNEKERSAAGMELMLLDERQQSRSCDFDQQIGASGETAKQAATRRRYKCRTFLLAMVGPVQVLIFLSLWAYQVITKSEAFGLVYRRIEGVDYALSASYESQMALCLGIALGYAFLIAVRDLFLIVLHLLERSRGATNWEPVNLHLLGLPADGLVLILLTVWGLILIKRGSVTDEGKAPEPQQFLLRNLL